MRGTIIKGIGGLYSVKAEDCNIYECKARGIFRKEKIKPMIGDKVLIEISPSGTLITEIEDRKNSLIRPSVANIDTLVAVISAKNPEPDFFLADKLLLMAEIRGITPIICITKRDLANTSHIHEVYKNTGYKIFDISSETGDGVEEFKSFLKGKTTALAGLSGVGKSSLLNLIVETELQTGEISQKISRGKHTTRHVELFELNEGGFVLDTPGFSSFEPDMIEENTLSGYYPEMRKYNDSCRFKGCSHINEPDCAVKNALCNGFISEERYKNYCQIYSILKNNKKW